MNYFGPNKLEKSVLLELEDIFSTAPTEKIEIIIEEAPEHLEPEEMDYNFSDLLQVVKKHNASDLHIKEGSPPMVRLDGNLFAIGEYRLSSEDSRELILSACNRFQEEMLRRGKEVDILYTDGGARFRINAYLQKSTYSASIRMLRTDIPTFKDLNLPDQLAQLLSHKHGLILVTGPAGTGKSTTLAAMIDYINTNQSKHIITIEDPIEYIHSPKKCLITQREVGTDTLSFKRGLKYSLRQDPDVILIGEMRDPDTIFTSAQASETGHLVLSSLHTPNTTQAIYRILDVFTGENQKQMRLLLASNLLGIVSQRLIPRVDTSGRVPAVEILVITPTISSYIVEGKINEIYPFISQGRSYGMQTMNYSLYNLYQKGIISYDNAMSNSDQQTELRMMIEGHSSTSGTSRDDSLISWI